MKKYCLKCEKKKKTEILDQKVLKINIVKHEDILFEV